MLLMRKLLNGFIYSFLFFLKNGEDIFDFYFN